MAPVECRPAETHTCLQRKLLLWMHIKYSCTFYTLFRSCLFAHAAIDVPTFVKRIKIANIGAQQQCNNDHWLHWPLEIRNSMHSNYDWLVREMKMSTFATSVRWNFIKYLNFNSQIVIWTFMLWFDKSKNINFVCLLVKISHFFCSLSQYAILVYAAYT